MREILNIYSLGGLTAVYRREGETVELLLVPEGSEEEIIRTDCAAEPLVQAKLQSDDFPAFFSAGRTMRNSPTTRAIRYVGQTQQAFAEKTIITTELADMRGLSYTHTLTLFADNPSATLETSVTNCGDSSLTFEMLSSFALGSLSPFSDGLAPETLKIHRLRSTWSAEGRLVTERAEDLQLEPSWKSYSANCVRFGSVGSFPVRGFVPFCGVEDISHGITWAATTTHGSSWQMELYRQDFGLSFSGGLADWEFGAWYKTLAPGESFSAPKAVLTAVKGGVDKAAQALVENTRRNIEPILPEIEKSMPLIFNEFCSTWGKPTEESILRHIYALKDKQFGYYVIDAGWYDDNSFEEATKLGKWELSRKAFPHGLKYIVDVIHSAGMKAGIWFEFEVVGKGEPDCFTKNNYLLTYNGLPITAGNRRFWDMRKPDVQEYLVDKVINFLRINEIDYIKIDYNEAIGLGCDGAESLGEGLRQQILASQAFFERIRYELPDVVLEVCASGGHRLCHSFLELSCMASFSDAHECDEIPLIAANMHRILLPRQNQIWVVVKEGQPLQKLYYQICSGLLGRLCLSGEPDTLSSEQWEIMKKGTNFYVKAASVIDYGISTWYGPEVVSYRDPKGWQAIVRRGKTQTLIVVHTFNESPKTVTLPINGTITDIFMRDGLTLGIEHDLTVKGLGNFDSAAILIENEA